MKKTAIKILFLVTSISIVFIALFNIFKPILKANSLIFPFAVHPFDIAKVYPETWNLLKSLYFITSFFSFFILFNKLFNIVYSMFPENISKAKVKDLNQTEELSLLLGTASNIPVFISEKGLYQNILITGTIGTGKTSSAMYPFTKQLIEYKSSNSLEKLGMLILDVKGNYFNQVVKFTASANRLKDIICIDLSGNFKYNPLDKPHLSPIVLANRLKTILTIFSPNNSESYWLDKVEQILAESIKFCRLYNDGYVSFSEVHKLIMFPEYYSEKITITKKLFTSRKIYRRRSL